MIHDLKEGDHIEITVRGNVYLARGNGWVHVTLDGGNSPSVFSSDELAQAKITKLDPELKKGRAEIKSTGHRGHVIALDGDEAWFRFDYGDRATFDTSDLRNIPEDGQ